MNPRRQQAVEFFVRQGWTLEQSSGIVANLEAESSLRHDAVGDGGAAYGIAQWHPPRQAHFEALMGKPIQGSTYEEQLYFVHAEMQRSESKAGDALRDCRTAAEAAEVVCRQYERPKYPDKDSVIRANLANVIFAEQGGTFTPEAPVASGPAPTIPEKPVDPLTLLGIFGPIISQLIPQVGQLFGGEKNQRNVAVIGKIFDTMVEATGQTGSADVGKVGTAIHAMQTDGTVKKRVTEAVVTHPEIIGLLEVGGGIKAAREASVVIQNADRPFWYNPMFWVTVAFFPMMYVIVGAVLFTVQPSAAIKDIPWWAQVGFDQATRSGLVNLIVGMVFGGTVGVWFGTSYGSQRKTELAANAMEQAVAKP